MEVFHGATQLVSLSSLPAAQQTALQSSESTPVQKAPGKQFSKVLLLDGYSTRTLACVRSWGPRNIAFAVGGENKWDMSFFSRYSKEKFVYTSPKKDVSKFIQDVNTYARKFSADCVFPTSEAGIMACSEHREQLECYPIVPSQQVIDVAFSKARTLKLAESLGISVPKTTHISASNFDTLDKADIEFPVAVKSESSQVMHQGRTEISSKTSYCTNMDELRKECKSRLDKGQAVLVQQFIDGYGVGISGLFSNGAPVAVIGHRRLRESDPLGGPSALAESIALEPRLCKATSDLFQAIAFNGPAMAEYKVDNRTGRPYLMEINGRFWGTILLAPAAGLDLPYLYWKMLNGLEITPDETRYNVGVKGRYLVGDTKWLLLCLKGRPGSWPGQFPTRSSAIKSYLGSFFDGRTTDLIFNRTDPMPFVGRLLQELS
jgi:predicted ATP-grasp superfamily ATP-dependent carboligase